MLQNYAKKDDKQDGFAFLAKGGEGGGKFNMPQNNFNEDDKQDAFAFSAAAEAAGERKVCRSFPSNISLLSFPKRRLLRLRSADDDVETGWVH